MAVLLRSTPVFLLSALSTLAQSDQFFESKVRPLLIARCSACHGDKVQMGGIQLTTREGMHRASVVVPGDVDSSRLVQAVRYEGKIKMPPTGKLPEREIEALVRWVAEGGVWPEAAAPAAGQSGGHWAFQPVKKPETPRVSNQDWPRSDIDRFILAKLEQKNLAPASDADKHTLLRRVTLDLTGLLPTPAEIEEFVSDTSPQALERVVDRLLASPAFGDRWGRHWLDVTYWAETTGVGRRIPLKEAWRYRDYVIKAYNDDKPYNQFIREQIAGPAEKSRRDDNGGKKSAGDDALAATGFLVLGPWAWFSYDRAQLRMDVVDLQVDLVGRTFLGLTVGCARCHDHKFDPIPMKEYYGLSGIFRSTNTLAAGNQDGGVNVVPLPETVENLRFYVSNLEKWEKAVAETEATDKELSKRQEEIKKKIEALKSTAKSEEIDAEMKTAQEELAGLTKKRGYAPDKQIAAFTRYLRPAMPAVYAAEDMEFPEDARMLVRGDAHQASDVVPRGFLSAALYGPPPEISIRSSGRKELAEWIANEKNPLTTRVYVNRIWQHLFGEGIVATADNFGARGERPTHPELLDYLATRLTENGWSTKKTIREIVLSRVYQLSSRSQTDAGAMDPDNKFLWRANRRRLEAEAIRDTILQVSGRLDPGRGGPSLPLTAQNVHTIAPFFLEDDSWIEDGVRYRRTVYQPIMRGSQIEGIDILNLFDFADPDQVVGTRSSTTVPTQMLYLMNAPFVKEEARYFAERILKDPSLDDAGRTRTIVMATLNRPAAERDIQQARQFISDFAAGAARRDKPPANPALEAWARYCHAVFVSSEFLYRR